MQIIISVIAAIVSSGLFIWIFKEWLSTRLRASIKHEYDQKIESLKAELSRDATFHASAYASFSEGQKAAMERRLSSIDSLWQTIVASKNKLPSVLTSVDVLTEDESKDIRKAPKVWNALEKTIFPNPDAIFPAQIDEVRPYVGEKLWLAFYVYRAVSLRVSLVLLERSKKTGSFSWIDDQLVCAHLRTVLTKDEMLELKEQVFFKFFWARQKLEDLIINAANEIISGKDFVPVSLEQIKDIQQKLSQLRLGAHTEGKLV